MMSLKLHDIYRQTQVQRFNQTFGEYVDSSPIYSTTVRVEDKSQGQNLQTSSFKNQAEQEMPSKEI